MRSWLEDLAARGLIDRFEDGTWAPANGPRAVWWRDVERGINGLIGEREVAA